MNKPVYFADKKGTSAMKKYPRGAKKVKLNPTDKVVKGKRK